LEREFVASGLSPVHAVAVEHVASGFETGSADETDFVPPLRLWLAGNLGNVSSSTLGRDRRIGQQRRADAQFLLFLPSSTACAEVRPIETVYLSSSGR